MLFLDITNMFHPLDSKIKKTLFISESYITTDESVICRSSGLYYRHLKEREERKRSRERQRREGRKEGEKGREGEEEGGREGRRKRGEREEERRREVLRRINTQNWQMFKGHSKG